MAKKKLIPIWLIIVGIIVILALWVGNQYNRLVTLEEDLNYTWANVETQYQRRADLIPNLVATVEGVADFEQGTLTAVTAARTQWQNVSADPSSSLSDRVAATGQFDSAISRLLVTVEAYPTLRANENFLDLQTQLEGTENRVAVARKDFNEEVNTYNKGVRRFPMALFAKLFGFEVETPFEAVEGAEVAPDVEFDF